jgi:threonine/homoserine efflux transporter RhtA
MNQSSATQGFSGVVGKIPAPELVLGGVCGIQYGAALAAHHLAFYEAVNHIPLGAVATIEFRGPFAIALAGSRRAVDLLPACLAAGGVLPAR